MASTRTKTRHPGVYLRIDSQGQRRYQIWFEDSNGKATWETLPLGTLEGEAAKERASRVGRVAGGETLVRSKITLREFAGQWLDDQEVRLKPKTRETYQWGLDSHVLPALGRKRVVDITVDDVARFILGMTKKGYKPATIKNALAPLSRVLQHAVRRGLIGANPVRGLEKHERPRSSERKMMILSSEQIPALIAAVPERHRTFVETAISTGLRFDELLSLRWEDVSFEQGFVIVQDSKTEAGAGRKVVLIPSLARRLREHRTRQLELGLAGLEALVFPTDKGTKQLRRNVARRGLEKAQKDLGWVDENGKHLYSMHDMRHTFASILIGRGLDVTVVADQLGHADPGITLKVYAKLFDPARRRDEARVELEAAIGGAL